MLLSKPLQEYATETVVLLNKNGGFYCWGKRYPLSDKMRVLEEFLCLKNKFGSAPSARHFVYATQVSKKYAGLVLKE